MIYKAFVETAVQRGKETYEKEFQKISSDGRKDIVGDNYLDINDNKYGNNVLLTSEAATGTMQAGIVGGKRGNGLGGDGIIDQAEIMCLRVGAGSGEPYLKTWHLLFVMPLIMVLMLLCCHSKIRCIPRIRKHGCQRLFVMQKARAY